MLKHNQVKGFFSADTRIEELKAAVIEVNEDATHCVPLHPLYVNTGLSVDQLYAEVVLREDLTSIQRTDIIKPEHRHRIVNNPSDIFTKDGKPVRNVYLLGQPGYGKTTFCLHLLNLWCAAKTVAKPLLSIWQLGMFVFDFVFYISLRHVDRCRSSIVEMICEDVFERDAGNTDVIRHVLRSPDYRCLVVVDGLDEWVLSPEVKAKLKHRGLPNTGGLSSNSTVLYASRHWKIELMQPKYSKNDIVLEILGLNDKGVDTIIHNILVNFFMHNTDTLVYKSKSNDIKKHLQRSKSSRKVSLLVTMSVYLGFDGKYAQVSDTGLVLDQIEFLIRRALESVHIERNFTDRLDQETCSTIDVPKIIQMNKFLSQFIVVLYKLGEIAFNDLISNESHLVFDRQKLVSITGERVLDIALKVGIVSQVRAPGRFRVPKVSIEFLHKSIQEAMAALYVVCQGSDAVAYLCGYCCSVEKAMEMATVIQYITGLSPVIGSELSVYIAKLEEKHHDTLNERESPCRSKIEKVPKGIGRSTNVYESYFMVSTNEYKTYSMTCRFVDEMAHTLSLTKDSTQITQYRVSSVLLDADDTMHDSIDSILSFYKAKEHGHWITGPPQALLPQRSHLNTLKVLSSHVDPELVNVIPKLKHLQNVGYWHSCKTGDDKRAVDSRIVRAFLQLPQLKYMQLVLVDLDNDTLFMANHMTKFQTIDLNEVCMSPEAWERFAKCMHCVRHDVDVSVWHYGYGRDLGVDSLVVRVILKLPRLRYLILQKVELDDDVMMMTDSMGLLQKIELIHVSMSLQAWERFGTSLRSMKHKVEVKVDYSGDEAIFPLTTDEGNTYVDVDCDKQICIIRTILKLPLLKHVRLLDITLRDDVLMVTDDMTLLRKIHLERVSMSPESWNRFVISVFRVKFAIDVTIECCNIDSDTDDLICQSKSLILTKREKNRFGDGLRIHFTNVPEGVV